MVTTKKPTKPKVEKKSAKPKKVEVPKQETNVVAVKNSTRGRVFEGTVISDKMNKTITVEWPRQVFLPKFERFEKRRTRVKVHVPASIDIKVNDFVKIAECRPISKTKNFIVIKKLEAKSK